MILLGKFSGGRGLTEISLGETTVGDECDDGTYLTVVSSMDPSGTSDSSSLTSKGF